MKNYSKANWEDRHIVLTQWYEGSFSYTMRNLEDYVNDIYDEDEVESTIENEVEIAIENEDIDNITYGGNIVIDDIDMFKEDMVDYLINEYEEQYLSDFNYEVASLLYVAENGVEPENYDDVREFWGNFSMREGMKDISFIYEEMQEKNIDIDEQIEDFLQDADFGQFAQIGNEYFYKYRLPNDVPLVIYTDKNGYHLY